MNPVVSIVIPTFNSQALLGETLDSVLAQTYAHWECLIVDDSSTDSTLEVITTYTNKDSRFKRFVRPSTAPKGANACRNYGFKQSTGDYLIFLDADDLLQPECLSGRVAAFKDSPKPDGLVFSAMTIGKSIDKQQIQNVDPQQPTSLNYLKMFLSYNLPWQTTCPIWKRSSLNNYGIFNQQLQRFQDVEFHTRLLLQGAQVKRITQVDFYYRIPSQNSKYSDAAFLDIAYTAMLQYMRLFSVEDFTSSVLTARERRPLLFGMLNKIIMQQLIPKGLWHWVPRFTKLAKQSKIITPKQAMAIRLFVKFKRYGWDKRKGFGMYSLYKWTLNTSKLHKV